MTHINAHNYTTVNIKKLTEISNGILEGLKVASNDKAQEYAFQQFVKAMHDSDLHAITIWSLIRIQLFEQQLVIEDPENCAQNVVVNGGL